LLLGVDLSQHPGEDIGNFTWAQGLGVRGAQRLQIELGTQCA